MAILCDEAQLRRIMFGRALPFYIFDDEIIFLYISPEGAVTYLDIGC